MTMTTVTHNPVFLPTISTTTDTTGRGVVETGLLLDLLSLLPRGGTHVCRSGTLGRRTLGPLSESTHIFKGSTKSTRLLKLLVTRSNHEVYTRTLEQSLWFEVGVTTGRSRDPHPGSGDQGVREDPRLPTS